MIGPYNRIRNLDYDNIIDCFNTFASFNTFLHMLKSHINLKAWHSNVSGISNVSTGMSIAL